MIDRRGVRIFSVCVYVALVVSLSFLDRKAVGMPQSNAAAAITDTPPLRFRIDEGRNTNLFVRDGPVAAHLVLRSGTDLRFLAAFPANNSGIAVWFEKLPKPLTWSVIGQPRPVASVDAMGRPLHGAETEIAVDTASLEIRRVVLSSMRAAGDYQATGAVPPEIDVKPTAIGNRVTWSRNRIDGAPGYRLTMEVIGGTATRERITAGADGRLRLKVTALSGDPPMTPLGGPTLLTEQANPDQRTRDALAFLSYREKFLAGSWRFNAYFGRDTLMSLRLLMPVLQRGAVEDGLRSVLTRLASNGEVAHEEDIGEFVILRHIRESGKPSDRPIYNYSMVDDDFMLAPVAAAWLLDQPRGREAAAAFLASKSADGTRAGDALVRNLDWVVARSAAFAARPVVANLVALKDGRDSGQWRDSHDGLGGGRYPFDVNAVFVPAALGATHRLLASGLLDPYVDGARRLALARARRFAAIWQAHAPPLFAVMLPNARARADVRAYAATVGVDASPGLAAIGTGALRFNAVSLDATGCPVPILNSDDGFAFLFGALSPADIERSLAALWRPFPAGLMTDVGMLVANPAFAEAGIQRRLGPSAYHGAVVWAWQQAIMAAGIDRQLQRDDLSPSTRTRLLDARRQLWAMIGRAKQVRTSELWSWSYVDGRYRVEPFGKRNADADESNAAQLWSTVFLALRPPSR